MTPLEKVIHELASSFYSTPDGVGWVKIYCPFHMDRYKSAVINLELQVFKCFACPVEGDPIHVIMKAQVVDFVSAKYRYEKIVGEKYTGVPNPDSGESWRTIPFGTRDYEGKSSLFPSWMDRESSA